MRSNEKIFAHEKVQFNLVRFQKYGKNFEIVVDPDLAIEFKNKRSESIEDLSELVKSEHIFSDAKKGELANEDDLEKVFLTNDFYKIALRMIKEGEIQLSSEHREKLREDKKKQIVTAIHRIAIDPRSGLPHPLVRIESAIAEAKIKVNEYKRAEDQVQDVINLLKPILPIRVEEKILHIRLPVQYAPKLQGYLKSQGDITSEDWLSDGSYACKLKVPAGVYADLVDELGSRTKGSAEIDVINK
jgi:ribosome maturation protein SDO1